VVPPSGAPPLGTPPPFASRLWEVTPNAIKTRNNTDFFICLIGFRLVVYKFGTKGTELVGGGGGGGGGPPPASNLAAPKLAQMKTTHTHNLTFFTIKRFLNRPSQFTS
jgi:hypothetical protein